MRQRLPWGIPLLIAAFFLLKWLKREGLLDSGWTGDLMPKAHPTQALLIECGWCGSSIPTFRRQAWLDAVDHALDEHRVQLLATPEYARRFLRIVNPETGKRARITPTSPQEPASS